jgi:oxygen-independent coproporphyrinogen-3 oxidase
MAFGIYIHIPFCSQNCKYCHFVTVPLDRGLLEKYRTAVIKEISLYSQSLDENIEVDSIYIGGGTPSLLPAEYLEEILGACNDSFSVSGDCEISMEANPDTVRKDKSLSYKQNGINRISIGAQSFHNRELKAIGRNHNAGAIAASVNILRESGFSNINLDLLLGLPFQTAGSWRKSLDGISNLDVSHVSVYMLDLDEPCPLSESVADGSVSVPGDDLIADSYLETIDILASYGYQQYEISNFTRPGCACRHNLKYWLRNPVAGFGLSSHSFDGYSRYANFSTMNEYLHSLESGRLPVAWRKPLQEKQKLEETLFLGLRLNEGIQWARLQQGYRGNLLEKYENSLRMLGHEGFVEWNDTIVRLTPSGMLLSNEIFQLFV